MNKLLIIGAIVGALTLAGVILWLNKRHQDSAEAIIKPCGPLKQSVEVTNIRIDDSAKKCFSSFVVQSIAWNAALDSRVVRVSTSSAAEWTEFADAFAGGPEPVGRFLVVSGSAPSLLASPATIEDRNAKTRIRWNHQTCKIGYGVIFVPDCSLPVSLLNVIAAHEIGHALGVGHNADFRSYMAPIVESDRPIDYHLTPGDIDIVRKAREP